MKKGFIQVYTGDGKGKTTAALGLALRASGAGLKVYIGQFMKKGCFSEHKALKKFTNIKAEQFGQGCLIRKKPTAKDKTLALKGFSKIKKIINKGDYDLVILDEINLALSYKLLSMEDVLALLKEKPKQVEIILTGRKAPIEIIKIADLVTEMKEKKHYYKKGECSRVGIER